MSDPSTLSADYVIVGGGSAGSVLANRLSEDGKAKVLLIEAGGEAKDLLVQIPVGFAKLVANPKYDWCYDQEADLSIGGRKFLWSAGKMLGGSSSINGQVYIRGTRRDFDLWEQQGATGWNFDSVLPYFIRSETWSGEPDQARGSHGPLSVSPMRDPHPLCFTFIKGCNELGLPSLPNYHTGNMEGVFLTDTTQRHVWRCSTEKAYIRPARSRANLTVVTNAEVGTIDIGGGRATGVTFKKGGATVKATAAREVLVTAGTMGSAALLMRSGIGPGAMLQAAGITVVHDSAGVGKNLMEHAGVGQSRFVNKPTLNSETGWWHMMRHAFKFAFGKRGPFGAPAVQVMGLARTREGLDEPDVQIHFLPLTWDIDPDATNNAFANMPNQPAVTITATLCRPQTRGHLGLTADGRPRVVHQLMGDRRDVETAIGGMKLVERLFKTPSLAALVTADRTPSPMLQTDEDWEAFVRAKAGVSYHAAGTCRMGTDGAAVVDPQLRVRGVAGLRVADASVMPSLPSTNTNAPTIMIAERAAEFIKAA